MDDNNNLNTIADSVYVPDETNSEDFKIVTYLDCPMCQDTHKLSNKYAL